MKVVERFINRSEEIAFKELSSVANDNGLRAFPKSRLSDVLLPNGERLSDRVFAYYTRAHFDFVVTDFEYKPYMAVEYDGPYHSEGKQVERDAIKNNLCQSAGLPLLRIGANHVTRQFRGMTLLRWIVEVSQLRDAFEQAQASGYVPYDEPFDPSSMYSRTGEDRKWPYWLSAEANIRINRFMRAQPGQKAWITLRGEDALGNMHSLAYLRIRDEFLYVKTAARNQGVGIPVFDMLDQVTNCEMDEELTRFQSGQRDMIPLMEFKAIHDRICRRYNMHPGSRTGTGLDLGPIDQDKVC